MTGNQSKLMWLDKKTEQPKTNLKCTTFAQKKQQHQPNV
jgi:hypothetical protein